MRDEMEEELNQFKEQLEEERKRRQELIQCVKDNITGIIINRTGIA